MDLHRRSFSRADDSTETGTSDSQKGRDPANTQDEVKLPIETSPEFAGSTSLYVVLRCHGAVELFAVLDAS